MKNIKKTFLFSFIAILLVTLLFTPKADAAFNKNLLMDNVVFDKKGSMSESQIQTFINKYPSSCLKRATSSDGKSIDYKYPNDYFTYGANVSAAKIIKRSSDLWGLNPHVILATLEKESSLVSGGSGCQGWRYVSAMGYNCPDSGELYSYPDIGISSTCVARKSDAGFSRQVNHASWQLMFNRHRSEGNIAWDGDGAVPYVGYMTKGNRQRVQGGATVYYDGKASIDGQVVTMSNGATASLYSYTPHFAGNQSFYNIFTGWFGSTLGGPEQCTRGSNISGGVGSGFNVLPIDTNLALTVLNNTGSTCIEIHTWQPGNKSWRSNIATNYPAINPAHGEVISQGITTSSNNEVSYIKYADTASGRVEIHTWKPGYRAWAKQATTNLPVSEMSNGKVVPTSNGLAFVKYSNTGSGKIEIHTWKPGYQQWISQIATNLPGGEGSNGKVIATSGGLTFVKYSNTGSGKIEIHTWKPGYKSWRSNIATNADYAL